MSNWITWLVLAAVVAIAEIYTGTFYLLMIAVGLVAGAVASLFSQGNELPMIVAGLVGASATLALHKSKYGYRKSLEAARNPDVNMDIGQTVNVASWTDQGNGIYFARTAYRGAQWDVELRHSAPHAGAFIIEEIQGSRLIVRPS